MHELILTSLDSCAIVLHLKYTLVGYWMKAFYWYIYNSTVTLREVERKQTNPKSTQGPCRPEPSILILHPFSLSYSSSYTLKLIAADKLFFLCHSAHMSIQPSLSACLLGDKSTRFFCSRLLSSVLHHARCLGL